MHNLKIIRTRLGITQRALAHGLGCTQGNVANCESGQALLPDLAKKLIDFAGSNGLAITWDHVYGSAPLPELLAQKMVANV